jgi:AcrR family transcriptional regulator
MPGSPSSPQPASLRAEQVAQTRAALVRAGRRMFGEMGFRATSVEDLGREARVTTGALYHHFPTKTALFEAVFEQAHHELMTAAMEAAKGATDDLDVLARGFEAFLDGVLQPDVQRILVLDGPAVLGLARYTELDERYAFAVIVARLTAAAQAGTIRVDAAGCAHPGSDVDRELSRPGRDPARGRAGHPRPAEQFRGAGLISRQGG